MPEEEEEEQEQEEQEGGEEEKKKKKQLTYTYYNSYNCTQHPPKTASVVPPEDGSLTPETCRGFKTQ
jgi:hypothetical protein